MSYKISIEPHYDSESENQYEDVVFEFERIGAGFGETISQLTIRVSQNGYRAYSRDIALRGDGLRALYYGLKRMFDPSMDEID